MSTSKSNRFNKLDGDEYERVQDELSAQSNVLGLSMWSRPGQIMKEDLDDIYGICATCKHFFYCRREFGEPMAACQYLMTENGLPIRLTGQSRMVECRGHAKRSHLTLGQMMDIAWIIEDTPGVGFIEGPRGKGRGKGIQHKES